jgi:hypothetical protein
MGADKQYPDAKHENSLEIGHQYQDFVMDELIKYGILLQCYSSKKYQYDKGESLAGIEVKYDDWCTRSNRLSIEVQEKADILKPEWTDSGILRQDNTWLYVQGDYNIIYVFAKRFLVNYFHAHVKHKGLVPEEKHGTIKTFYLDEAHCQKYAALIIRP